MKMSSKQFPGLCTCDHPYKEVDDAKLDAIQEKIIKLIEKQMLSANSQIDDLNTTMKNSQRGYGMSLGKSNFSRYLKVLLFILFLLFCLYIGMLIGAKICGKQSTNVGLVTY